MRKQQASTEALSFSRKFIYKKEWKSHKIKQFNKHNHNMSYDKLLLYNNIITTNFY